MEIIKCPQCGESDLIEIGPGVYKCNVCGATVRNDKVDEILQILKNDPDNFIGNLKYRLSNELNKEHLDVDAIRNLSDKILDRDPEDIFCSFLIKYTNRKKNRSDYKYLLRSLCEKELPTYIATKIARLLVTHYEGYYKDIILNFIQNHSLTDSFGDDLNDAIKHATNEITLKDPFVKRDVFIVCDDEDFNFATKIVDLLNDNNISTWFEPVNFDYDNFNREEQVFTAAKHTKLTIVMNSINFRQNRDLRLETKKIINSTLDEDLKEHGLTRTLLFNIDNGEIDNSFNECISYDYNNYSDSSFLTYIQEVLHKLLNKEDYINNVRLDEVIELRKSKHYKKALRRIEDLLEEDLDSNDELTAHLEALRCLSNIDDEYSEDAYEHANKIKRMVNQQYLSKYEDELPILIDERRVYSEGLRHLAKKEFIDAIYCFNKASKKEYPNAFNKLGEMYFLGRGVEQNIDMALDYFDKASNLDCADANRNLGMMYLKGNKVEKDVFKAFKYFLKGAEKNNPFCSMQVALCYHDGIGTVKDDVKYYEFLKIAAKGELPRAIYLLGKCYKYGKGTEANEEYAYKCFTYAAEKGDFDARRELMGF